MRVRRIIPYPITALLLLTIVSSYAQSSSWLKRSWEGKAYTLGTDPQRYDLVLNISSIKGKNFEGVIKAVQPQDTSQHFDSKISGTIFDRYLRINIGPWKVKCGSCKPQVLEFSMESGKFFMKGEAKGCSTVECTWITEFSEPLVKFNTTEQDMLFAVADEVKPPEPDTTAVVQNTPPPVKDTVAVVQKETPLPPPARIVLLPAGNIVSFERNTTSLFSQKPPTNLRKKLSLTIPETAPPPPKISVPPAGDVALTEHKSDISFSSKPPASLNKTTWMIIPETTPPAPRITVPPAGDIVSSQHTSATSLSQPPGLLQKNTSITVDKTTPPPPRINVTPAGEVVSSAHTTANTGNTPALPNKNLSVKVKENTPVIKRALPKDTAVALPTDYTERKKNVIRTLIVNTDSIVLRVYDNGVVDGDIVSVIYNDKVVVDKLPLNKNAVVVKIPVKKSGINTLVFHAHNLGEFPPNTALLEILYGTKREELTVSSDLTVSSTIDIEYKQ